MRLTLLICALAIIAAINIFAIHFGASDSRRIVRIASVASGLLALLCVISIPGAFLHYLLSSIPSISIALIKTFAVGSILFTATSLAFDIAIALRLRRIVA